MLSKDSQPRDPKLIKQELRELELSSASSREWLDTHPGDKLVSLLVEQSNTRKNQLINELEDSYSFYHCHHFTYAIKTEDKVEISSLSALLTALSNVINATLATLDTSTTSIPLYFDTVVQSSFGVLLSTDWDPELVDTSIERTFNKFFDINSILQSSFEVTDKDVFSTFSDDKALMRKYRSFYRGVAFYNNSVELKWGGFLQNHQRSSFLDHDLASQIYKRLSKLDHPESEEIKMKGSIQGISLLDKTIIFVPHQKEGTRIKLLFEEPFKERLKPLLGEVATIIYQIITEYDEFNDRIVTTKALIEIEEPKDTRE